MARVKTKTMRAFRLRDDLWEYVNKKAKAEKRDTTNYIEMLIEKDREG